MSVFAQLGNNLAREGISMAADVVDPTYMPRKILHIICYILYFVSIIMLIVWASGEFKNTSLLIKTGIIIGVATGAMLIEKFVFPSLGTTIGKMMQPQAPSYPPPQQSPYIVPAQPVQPQMPQAQGGWRGGYYGGEDEKKTIESVDTSIEPDATSAAPDAAPDATEAPKSSFFSRMKSVGNSAVSLAKYTPQGRAATFLAKTAEKAFDTLKETIRSADVLKADQQHLKAIFAKEGIKEDDIQYKNEILTPDEEKDLDNLRDNLVVAKKGIQIIDIARKMV